MSGNLFKPWESRGFKDSACHACGRNVFTNAPVGDDILCIDCEDRRRKKMKQEKLLKGKTKNTFMWLMFYLETFILTCTVLLLPVAREQIATNPVACVAIPSAIIILSYLFSLTGYWIESNNWV